MTAWSDGAARRALRLTDLGAALLLALMALALVVAYLVGQHLQQQRCQQPGACTATAGVAWKGVQP